MDILQSYLKNKTTVLAGQSGVGKSTLLNTMLPELDLKTGIISQSLGRGKHTTRHVELMEVAGGLLADTPGFSSFDFDMIERGSAMGAPKYMEWYGAFGLLVTLIWLYLEILRLLAKMNSRK